MDAKEALADLMEISSQVEAAVLVDERGEVVAATFDDERAGGLARAAQRLVEAAPADGDRTVAQLQAATRDGSVFVVRDGGHLLAATTGASPTVGLVFYDLRTCLRGLEPEKPKRRRRKSAEA